MSYFARIGQDGRTLDFGGPISTGKFRQFAKENIGLRVEIVPLFPESKKQRGWFEGAVVPLITYYQSGLDYKDPEDRANVREWLKLEFNGQFVNVAGKAHRVPSSTKGKLNDGFLERVVDWLIEQYSPPQEALDPNAYKKWRDEVYAFGGPDTYIDYLEELKIIKR